MLCFIHSILARGSFKINYWEQSIEHTYKGFVFKINWYKIHPLTLRGIHEETASNALPKAKHSNCYKSAQTENIYALLCIPLTLLYYAATYFWTSLALLHFYILRSVVHYNTVLTWAHFYIVRTVVHYNTVLTWALLCLRSSLFLHQLT